MPQDRRPENDAFAVPPVDSAPVSTRDQPDGAAQGPRSHHRPLSRRAFAVLSGLSLALVITAPAFAHADLVTSSPKDKAVLETPPTKVTLTFSEGLDPGRSSFKLIGSDGTVGTGKVTEASAEVMALDGLTLAPGAYEVRWTAGSPDGHIIRGKLTFTVTEPTPAPATPAPTPEPTAAVTTEPSAAVTAAPTTAPGLGSATPAPATPVPGDDAMPAATSTTDMLIPIVVGLIVVAGIGALVLRRSRRA